MRTLLIDNYDSFTYNLFQLLAEVNGVEPLVVRNDEASWSQLEQLEFDNVVISPGPGRPERGEDFGVCAEAIRSCDRPLLGVCLGLQGMGWVEGGRVERAPEPMHGRVVAIEHDGTGLFAGISSPFQAVRYHSLAVTHPLPSSLRETASSEGVSMAVEHRHRPQWGVQFHPESIATEHGARLLANFRDLTQGDAAMSLLVPRGGKKATSPAETRLSVRTLDAVPDVESAFAALYGESDYAFWLDSSRAGERGRFSFMGDASGPLGEVIHHEAGHGEPLFTRLQQRMEQLRPAELPDLPFEFDCGFVGYLGYELKSECGYGSSHPSPHPDAALIFSDRLVAFDHEQEQTYLLCLHERGREKDAEVWISTMATRMANLGGGSVGESGEGSTEPPRCCSGESSPDFPLRALSLGRPPVQHLEDIETCLKRLLDGESYEICLTNQLTAELDVDPLDLYRRLRSVNPAPFAAYLRFGDMAVLSSSPERFLRVNRGGEAEARPIKGTSRRGATAEEDAQLATALAASEKNQAENLMIVDLLRNDLGAVCEIGSVDVPAMMEVETYETVHQLVSEVRGQLRSSLSALDCIRSCFPPGSMTGAPKKRTTEILDELEGAARGVYSGAIGWFGLGGAADLSVAIRTIALAGGRATIGAGGAIVLQSDPAQEYEEMLLKAAASLRAIDSEADPASISLALQSAAAAALPR